MSNVLIMASDGFEQSELLGPKEKLEEAGASVTIASLEEGEITGWDGGNWGKKVPVDTLIADASADDYDALVLPGGQINPDVLRNEKSAIALICAFNHAEKPIAAICHAPWLLVEADLVCDKMVTSWPSIRTDLRNAGGYVVDREVAVDGHIITSRNPDDIPAFTKALGEKLELQIA